MTADKDKYAVVVDGDVVDLVATKKEAKEVLAAVSEDAETEVRPLKEEDKDKVKPLPKGDANGIVHLR